MASELKLIAPTGQTWYAVITSGLLFVNGTSLEAYNAGHWTNYAVALTDADGIGQYVGDMPVVAAGWYQVEYYKRAGGSPATSDGPALAAEEFYWTGTRKGPPPAQIGPNGTIFAGDTEISRIVPFFDDAGDPVSALVAATMGTVQIWNGITNVVMPALSDLAAIDSPWTAGGVFEIGGGRYRMDFPNSTAASSGTVTAWVEASGKHMWHTFDVMLADKFADILAQLSMISSGSITLLSPVTEEGNLLLVKGDDYRAADGRAVSWSLTGVPDLTGATATLSIFKGDTSILSASGSIMNPTSDPIISFDLTADLPVTPRGQFMLRFAVSIVLADGNRFTPNLGRVDVLAGAV